MNVSLINNLYKILVTRRNLELDAAVKMKIKIYLLKNKKMASPFFYLDTKLVWNMRSSDRIGPGADETKNATNREMGKIGKRSETKQMETLEGC